MNEPNIERIRKYLQDKEVQERIQERMLDARSKATVTISRAAGIFEFSESQLREWEKRELLKTERTALSENGKTSKGHRQFFPDELDELALIRELLNQGYSLSEIPPNIDVIWKQILTDWQTHGQVVAAFIEKYQKVMKVYSTAIACLQRDLEVCVTFYTLPKEHRKTTRINNVLERLYREIQRRFHKMAAAFRTEGSWVLLFNGFIRCLYFNKLMMPASSLKQPDAEI